jgi:hypothetical protein
MDLILNLGRYGWSAFWVFIAIVLAGSTLAYSDTLLSGLGFIFWAVTPCLFLAFAGRFLFTGYWRRPREERRSDGVLSPRGQIGTHQSSCDVLPRPLTGQRRVGSKDGV